MTAARTPYADLPDTAFWRRAIVGVPAEEVDPVGDVPFVVGKTDRIATAGSCFATRLSQHLAKSGFNYFVTEPGHPFLGSLAADYNYGTFSARYGNLYTSRQLVQLFDRAYKAFTPAEDLWTDGEGRYFDPFRPNIQPNGFASEQEYWADREQHFAAVRQLFEQLDVLVFTMGLTEQWLSRTDGAAYPVCPGVVTGTYDPDRYRYHNLTSQEVADDLTLFIDKLRGVNPQSKVILTVSPVPIIATMEPRHVLVSSTFTKCALRVACDVVVRRCANVAYFPGYEMVASNFNRGRYVADDLRSVTDEGVDRVMDLFYRHYGAAAAGDAAVARTGIDDARARVAEMARFSEQVNQALCDEEMLDSEPV